MLCTALLNDVPWVRTLGRRDQDNGLVSVLGATKFGLLREDRLPVGVEDSSEKCILQCKGMGVDDINTK